jgi:membrane protease YdiL (CAAX protease family)
MWPHSPAWTIGIAVVGSAAVLGLVTDGSFHYVTRKLPSHFLGVGSSVANLVWRLGILAVIVCALAFQHRSPVGTTTRMWSVTSPASLSSAVAVPMLVVLYAIAFLWARIPVIGKSAASNPGAYKSAGTLSASAVLLLLTVRYPLTVFAEETLFRGYLWRTLGWGMVVGSVAFAGYHLTQWRTIPSLIPYNLAGGVIVLWTGALWPAAVVHYLLDAGFAVLIVRPAQRRATDAVGRSSRQPCNPDPYKEI